MHRVAWVGFATLAVASGPAAAETQVGGWFGPRVYSTDSQLGYISSAPFHPMLENGITFGLRVARKFYFPWLYPEFELALAPASTTPTGTESISVFWMDPRVHLRFELMPGRRIQPFVVVGGGSPIALSSARKTFNSGITGDGYLGGGVRFDMQKGFTLRVDARVALLPGVERIIAPEIDIGLGIELAIGGKRGADGTVVRRDDDGAPDRDADGIPDAKDGCPDRAEDEDGFEDTDGCPDIDNDLDRVLDIADKCPTVAETYNGFQDDDGCPDALPPEVDALRGTIEGLIYAEGETMVRDAAKRSLDKIAKVMTTNPSIRVVLIGHTDDREAKQFATTIEGQPPPDLAALSADLSRGRAEAVAIALSQLAIAKNRIDVEGHGAEEPVAENDKPRGRLANRRVEIKLYVPPSAGRPL
jgi:outer membrane protein OmpA-like peptidoglycan-associated protein